MYDWLVPQALLDPVGSAAAFGSITAEFAAGAEMLDCACGPGHLAVGLAHAGFAVTATDASRAMIDRTQALAVEHQARLTARECSWEELPQQSWNHRFSAVFCVGNSLVHAAGTHARQTALRAMASVLAPGGLLVITSRNWEQVRRTGSCLAVDDDLVDRNGQQAVIVHAWTVPSRWDAAHQLRIAVAKLEAEGHLDITHETLQLWPFRHEQLTADLARAGLTVETSTYQRTVPRYLITARRP